MKKVLLTSILAIILAVFFIIPVGAVPAGEEEWTFAEARGGTIRATYFINTTTLFTSSFNCYNESDYYAKLTVYYNGAPVWSQMVIPHSTWTLEYKVKFFRTPKNDPEDPDHIRYPNGYSFGMWTGSNPDQAP